MGTCLFPIAKQTCGFVWRAQNNLKPVSNCLFWESFSFNSSFWVSKKSFINPQKPAYFWSKTPFWARSATHKNPKVEKCANRKQIEVYGLRFSPIWISFCYGVRLGKKVALRTHFFPFYAKRPIWAVSVHIYTVGFWGQKSPRKSWVFCNPYWPLNPIWVSKYAFDVAWPV